jgi:hypothetical protein
MVIKSVTARIAVAPTSNRDGEMERAQPAD